MNEVCFLAVPVVSNNNLWQLLSVSQDFTALSCVHTDVPFSVVSQTLYWQFISLTSDPLWCCTLAVVLSRCDWHAAMLFETVNNPSDSSDDRTLSRTLPCRLRRHAVYRRCCNRLLYSPYIFFVNLPHTLPSPYKRHTSPTY